MGYNALESSNAQEKAERLDFASGDNRSSAAYALIGAFQNDADLRKQNCERQYQNLQSKLGKTEADKRLDCSTEALEAKSPNAAKNNAPPVRETPAARDSSTVREPATVREAPAAPVTPNNNDVPLRMGGLPRTQALRDQPSNEPDTTKYAKDAPKSTGGYYIGTMRRHGMDPYIRQDTLERKTQEDQDESRGRGILTNALIAGSTFGVKTIHGKLGVNAYLGQSDEALKKPLQILEKNLGYRPGNPPPYTVTEVTGFRGSTAATTSVRNAFGEYSREMTGRALVTDAHKFYTKEIAKTMGAAFLVNSAIDAVAFRDSVISNRTHWTDLGTSVAMIVPIAQRIPLVGRVGVIAGAHLLNRYRDYKEQH